MATNKTEDYQIINGGNRDTIGTGDRIFIEYISGSGQGDQSYWCEFTSTYKAYRQKNSELIECGVVHETTGTDRNMFNATIDNKQISSDFLNACQIFTRIEKRTKTNN